MLARYAQVELSARPSEQEAAVGNRREGAGNGTSADGYAQTNLGVFREYVMDYLHTLPQIYQDRRIMVRQLAQSGKGLPLEINAYSRETDIVRHEALQSRIIEHILAKAAVFDLKIYQDPTNCD